MNGSASDTARPEPMAVPQIRTAAEALLAAGQPEEAIELVVAALTAVLAKTRDLELLVAKLQRAPGGTRSERVDPAQLALLFEQLCGQQAEPEPPDPDAEARADAELDQLIAAAEQTQDTPPRRRHTRRRGGRTRAVERRVHQVEVPPQERTCGQCGDETERIGVDITRG